MSDLKCKKCKTVWDGANKPMCPKCLAASWTKLPNMVTSKHDSDALPSAFSKFRSVVPTTDISQRPGEYFGYIAEHGTALYSTRHQDYCMVAHVPTGLHAGSAVPSGSAMPTSALNSYVIACAFGPRPHIYADDESRMQKQLRISGYQSLPICSQSGCDNICVPGDSFCGKHTFPAMAE